MDVIRELDNDSPAEDEKERSKDNCGNGSNGRRWVLDGLSFTVNPGERVALVGPSGSGKTTIVSLLPRLYDVGEGRIMIDGIDIREYRLRALRQSIAIVQQDSMVFTGTVRENLTYGRPQATDDEVFRAATAANAPDFIMALPPLGASPVRQPVAKSKRRCSG